jgi:hypothetical protein
MRFALGLTIIGAASLIAGLMMILVGETLRLKSAHSQGLVAGGEIAAICGLACGVALLVVLTVGPADRPARRRGPGGAGPVMAGDARRPALTAHPPPARTLPTPQAGLTPLPPPAGFVAPRVATPWPEPAAAAWSPPGYADEGWNPQPEEHWDPRASPGWDRRLGLGSRPQAEGGWGPGRDYAWHPAGPDDWDRGEAGDLGPTGYDGWIPDGPDGWGRDAWANEGGDAWVPDGPDGWMPPGQVPGGQGDWTARAGQVPGGQADWAEPAREAWAPGDQGVWIPDGLGGWEHRAQDDWGPAAAADPYPAGPAHGYLAGPRASDEEDLAADDDTSPIPVIPAADAPPAPFSVWEPASPRGRDPDEAYQPEHAEPPSADTQEKIEQIKDLYMTAEAIGEDALVRHFEQLKTQQRSLIREFFDKAGLGRGTSTHSPQDAGGDAVGESAADGASLPR